MNILIIGGGYGGMITALRLAGKSKTERVTITLISAEERFQQRIRNHQYAAGDRPASPRYTDLLKHTGINFLQGYVARIQADDNLLTVRTTEGERQLAYDILVYAVGSYTDVLSVPGVKDHALTLDGTHKEKLAAACAEANHKQGDILIVGGGLTGIETASEFAERYPQARVKLVTGGAFGAALSARGQAYLQQSFRQRNITVMDHSRVSRVEAGAVVLADGSQVAYDVCVWAGSFVAPALAQEAGLQVNNRRQMLIDSAMRSVSHPNIYGVGDAARFVPTHAPETDIRMACATAMPMGAHAADNIIAHMQGKPPMPFGFRYFIRCISLGRHDGLIQFVQADDTPSERIISGRGGAWVKELICRLTVWALYTEKRFPGLYAWPGQQKSATKHEDMQYGYSHDRI